MRTGEAPFPTSAPYQLPNIFYIERQGDVWDFQDYQHKSLVSAFTRAATGGSCLVHCHPYGKDSTWGVCDSMNGTITALSDLYQRTQRGGVS